MFQKKFHDIVTDQFRKGYTNVIWAAVLFFGLYEYKNSFAVIYKIKRTELLNTSSTYSRPLKELTIP